MNNGTPGPAATAQVGARIDFMALPERAQILMQISSGALVFQIPIAVQAVDPLIGQLRAAERACTGARLALVDAGGRPA